MHKQIILDALILKKKEYGKNSNIHTWLKPIIITWNNILIYIRDAEISPMAVI